MSRVVKKKVIDERMEFSDNFDESMLDRIENELGRSLTDEEQDGVKRPGKRARSAEEHEAEGVAEPLPAILKGEEPERKTSAQERPTPPFDSAEDKEQNKPPLYRKIAFKRWVALVAAVLLFVLLPALAWVRIQRQHHDTPVIQFVRHPVPVPHHPLESRFLVIASAGTKKDLVEMTVEFEFLNTSAFEKFQDRRTAIQDSCYRFIQTHNPADNSQKNWAKLVQQDMLAQLQTDFPKIHIESITLTQFNRL
jgi:hypothetical protein